MKFFTKLAVSVITIAVTIIGSIWGGFEHLDSRMESKVEAGKKDVLAIVYQVRGEGNALLKANDEKTSVQLAALNSQMIEMRKDVRSILGLTRRQATLKTTREMYFSKLELKENKL